MEENFTRAAKKNLVNGGYYKTFKQLLPRSIPEELPYTPATSDLHKQKPTADVLEY